MGKTDYLENALLNHTLRNVAYTPPVTVYVGLFTSPTSDAGGGTEVSGNAYARQAVTFAAPSGGACSNSNLITFPVATPSGWGTVTHAAIFDAVSGGNMLRHTTLTQARTVNAGDSLTFQIGQLIISEE